METRKFPIEFLVSYSFCQGEPGGSRKHLGVLPVYSSFAPAVSRQTKEFSISLLVWSWFPFHLWILISHKFWNWWREAGLKVSCFCRVVAIRLLPAHSRISDFLSLRLVPKSTLKILSITCRYSVLFPEWKIGEFSESFPEKLRRPY